MKKFFTITAVLICFQSFGVTQSHAVESFCKPYFKNAMQPCFNMENPISCIDSAQKTYNDAVTKAQCNNPPAQPCLTPEQVQICNSTVQWDPGSVWCDTKFGDGTPEAIVCKLG